MNSAACSRALAFLQEQGRGCLCVFVILSSGFLIKLKAFLIKDLVFLT